MAHSRTTRRISLLGTVAFMTFHAAGALAQSAAPGAVIVLDPVVIQGDATAADVVVTDTVPEGLTVESAQDPSQGSFDLATAVWTAVCWSVIIPLGWALSGRADLYRYLWRGVVEFDGVRQLTARMRTAGLRDIRVLPLPGWQTGITHTFLARRAYEEETA